MKAINFIFSCTLLSAGVSGNAQTKEHISEKRHAWSFNMTYGRHELFTSHWHSLRGTLATIGLGLGHYSERWFASCEINILQGPYGHLPSQDEKIKTAGSELIGWLGVSTSDTLLRGNNRQFGLLIGVSYLDMESKSLQPSQSLEEPFPTDILGGQYLSRYRLQSNQFLALPGFFFSWLKPLRASGREEELLTTRIEGYRLSFYLGIPLYSHYQASYRQHEVEEKRVKKEFVSIKDKGLLYGYSVFISLAILLGV